ncbi:hypothetical protein NIES4075_72030 [Tolypothrix sp. NIES-4075]|uniref:hypothetical protein n=1 Tax=Tolypothrix sp. NIES-4075 TaxID=2005459 RepID=UPI000B5CBACA|nr:hypothetical protein [Tolypothrix sp. NIES-4075]GAX46182.1 hypothetical protein NIES4075_72030 [Tolypothrix sp. NIES-4075]
MSKKNIKGAFVVCPSCKKATSVPKKEDNLLQAGGKVFGSIGVSDSFNLPLLAIGLGLALAGEAVDSITGNQKTVKCTYCSKKLKVDWQ